MRAYIALSFSKRTALSPLVLAIKSALQSADIEAFVFVDQYVFNKAQEKEMMQQAMKDIELSDFLIAEVSEKAIGIGVEVGYAKAKGLPVIYLRPTSSEHSTTVSGISDFSVFYEDEEDLEVKLNALIPSILNHP